MKIQPNVYDSSGHLNIKSIFLKAYHPGVWIESLKSLSETTPSVEKFINQKKEECHAKEIEKKLEAYKANFDFEFDYYRANFGFDFY